MTIRSALRTFAAALGRTSYPTITVQIGPAAITIAVPPPPPPCPCPPGQAYPHCLRHGAIPVKVGQR